nr:hypothetical protein [Tanacetum cinerariifolium]
GHLGDDLVVEGVKHPDDNGPGLDQSQFAVAGRDDLEDQLGTEGISSAANRSTCRFIGTVRDAGGNAGA